MSRGLSSRKRPKKASTKQQIQCFLQWMTSFKPKFRDGK